MQRRLSLLFISGLTFAWAVASAGESWPAYTMNRTEVRLVTSTAGDKYRVYVSWPESPAGESGYPVLVVLDGDDSFAIAAKTVQRMERYARSVGMLPGMVVGIGYPGESRRSLDYTPASALDADGRGEPVGGAAAFRRFLRDELLAELAGDFPMDMNRLSLMGHSYGGLFVLDTLFSEPALFRTYIASSPSIWFGDRVVLRKEKGLASKLQKTGTRTLVLTVGEYEQSAPPWQAESDAWNDRRRRLGDRRMVDDNRDLAQRLSAVPGLELHRRILTGETHGTAPLPAIGNALRFAFGDEEP